MFNYEQFLQAQGIDYVTRERGLIHIQCPFCGYDDPSQHMAISLAGRGWKCWRNDDHYGKSPVRLVQVLAHCSFDQAKLLVHGTAFVPTDFLSQVKARLMIESQERTAATDLTMPPEFRMIDPRKMSCRPYMHYLRDRGFPKPAHLSEEYDLRYCASGPFYGRIIIPLYYQRRLMTWTGRTISKREGQRYKTLTTDPKQAAAEGYPAGASIGHHLLLYDRLLKGGETICLCEGPFDALKIMELGKQCSVVATCFFTSAPSSPQVDLLHTLLPRYQRRYLILDQGTFPTALRITRRLTGLGVTVKRLPTGIKDPGELTPTSFARLLLSEN